MPTPSKFTAAVRQQILEVKRVGGPDSLAVAVAGINVETLRRWLAKGREAEEGTYHQFATEYEEAKAHPQVRALGLLYKKLPDSDSLLMKYVERQIKGYEPPALVPPQVNIGPTVISLSFVDGAPAAPKWLEAEVIDAQESPALGPGGDGPDPDQAAAT